MKHAFISYVRQNSKVVDKLSAALNSAGIPTWLDRNNISPGERWQDAIREAIENGDFFIACFSSNYTGKDSSYMNEELTIAIEALRRKPFNTKWFIPLRLDECEIPARNIGGGETLHVFQRLDLFPDVDAALDSLIKILVPKGAPMAPATRPKVASVRLATRPTSEIIEEWKNKQDLASLNEIRRRATKSIERIFTVNQKPYFPLYSLCMARIETHLGLDYLFALASLVDVKDAELGLDAISKDPMLDKITYLLKVRPSLSAEEYMKFPIEYRRQLFVDLRRYLSQSAYDDVFRDVVGHINDYRDSVFPKYGAVETDPELKEKWNYYRDQNNHSGYY